MFPSAPVTFEIANARSDDAVRAMQAYFDELAERFPEGFDPGDTLTADAHTFDPPHGAFVLVRSRMETVGCGGVHRLDERCGEIKRMWVSSKVRGQGIGRALLDNLEEHCSRLGYDTVRLDTNSVLTQAIRMYESSGYVSIPAYNDNPFAKRWFEKSLSEQLS